MLHLKPKCRESTSVAIPQEHKTKYTKSNASESPHHKQKISTKVLKLRQSFIPLSYQRYINILINTLCNCTFPLITYGIKRGLNITSLSYPSYLHITNNKLPEAGMHPEITLFPDSVATMPYTNQTTTTLYFLFP